MADAYTTFLNLTKPEVGGSRDAWGGKWNDNADAISLWAKATDALAKDAVAKTPANGAGQSIAGPLSLGAGYPFTSGGHVIVPPGYRAIAGSGSHFFESRNADGSMYATDIRMGSTNVFRVLNFAENAEVFRTDAAGNIYSLGRQMWHSGNLTPANYASKVDGADQFFAGNIQINRPYARMVFTYPTVRSMIWGIREDGNLYAEDTAGNGSVFSVRSNGDLWTKPLGDIGQRIESRAAAFADDRLNTARSEYANAAKTTGAYFTGDVGFRAGCFIDGLGGRWPQLRLYNDAYGNRFIQSSNAGELQFAKTDGNVTHAMRVDGSTWNSQFGDLNTRIESRGAAFADDRLATARAEYGQKVAKSGDAMTGALTMITSNSAPNWIDQVFGGVFRWRNQLHGDGNLVWKNGDNGDLKMYLTTGGGLWLGQLGRTVGDQIELRAGNYADDRLNTATARINNKSARLSFATDVVIGDVGNSALWEGTPGGVITGFQQNGTTGQARAFRVRQLQMSDSNGSWYACGYV